MDIPSFSLLPDNEERARVVGIRNGVKDLLATNYLSHFTDHSVTHSDQLCTIVDQLAASLDSAKRLNRIEAFVLYAACYLHDAGMQNQRAGETQAVKKILEMEPLKGQHWELLDLGTRQELVRKEHHRISQELVLSAVRNGHAAIGVTLSDDDKPGIIAALCLAHGLHTDTEEYREAVRNQGNLRVGLLSGLLRMADILDESQRRTRMYLQLTRTLPLESRLHWFRHYYVASIDIEPRAITVWFDFPVARRQQYKELFEPIQMPWIQAELGRHANVLAENGLSWHLQSRDTSEFQCVTQPMDDDLEMYAVEMAAKRRSDELRRERTAIVAQLRVARPTLTRQFDLLRESKEAPDELLAKATNIAEHLTKIGGKREAWMNLWSVFDRTKSGSSEGMRLATALRLGELMAEDDSTKTALRLIQDFNSHFSKLSDTDPIKIRYLKLWATILRDSCAYAEALEALRKVEQVSVSADDKLRASAEIAELHLLQGELDKVDLLEGRNATA